MTLLVISPDFASHATPLLTIAGAWRDRGEDVVVATGPSVAPMVSEAGFGYARLSLSAGSNPGISRPEDQPAGEDDHLHGFFQATRRGMTATLRYQAEARARDLLWEPVAVGRRTIDVVESVQPDIVMIDHLAFGASLGLRAASIPYVDVVLGHPRQLPVGDETYGMPGAWPSAIHPDPADIEDLRKLTRRVSADFTSAYNKALRELSATAERVIDAFAAHGALVLLNYPQVLHHPPRTELLPSRHAFLGTSVRREPPTLEVERWLERDAARPLVVVSLGTFMSARDDVLAGIVAALRSSDVRVAMATGSADPRRLGPIPPSWLVGAYLPQVALLERADVLVTHGGNNSITEALDQGVPMLILPFSTDQFDGAAALETAGMGLAADPNAAT
ncbi:MAG: glycosyltransferase, partial [Candidatus Limnocylindria bacterium]